MSTASSRPQPYRVVVSGRFFVLSYVGCTLLALVVGRYVKETLIVGPQQQLQETVRQLQQHTPVDSAKGLLPPPIAKGKRPPQTIYTAKNFDTARTATSSSLLIRQDGEEEGFCATSDNESCYTIEDIQEDKDAEHLPAGQHLLVDLKGVDGSFLNSEERLAYAMIEVVNEASLTLLSYHCHKMVPSGVSCVGVLLESHISFHTWPEQSVITLDLFTCGSNPLVPVVPSIERLFGVPLRGTKDKPEMIWSHKLRGFRPKNRTNALQHYDLGHSFLGLMILRYKKEIATVQTEFQRIDIYDGIDARYKSVEDYERSLSNDGSYQSKHPELFQPDRIVFLDGVMQSRWAGETAYHEALVHPAMFAHPNPKRVAIVGGGEGATLREVLKHKTVEKAFMVEIDEQMVMVSREHLPSWSDCSELQGSSEWCFDDPRTELHVSNALTWFIDMYGDDNDTKEKLDVIMIDALDPQDDVDFCDALYNNGKFLKSLYDALSSDGIMVIQVGPSPGSDDPPEHMAGNHIRAQLIGHLVDLGFVSLHLYDEGHSGLMEPWNYIVATKSQVGRRNWYRNEAQINLAIQKRLLPTNSGGSPVKYFDGATMVSYQEPSKRFENVYCRQEPVPDDCEDLRFDFSVPSMTAENFQIRESGAGEKAGRGVYAKVDIPKGTYLGPEEKMHSVHFTPSTFDLVVGMEAGYGYLEEVEAYMHGYGFQSSHFGAKEVTVDSGMLTFTNHGCNGTYNNGFEFHNLTEFTVSVDAIPEEFGGQGVGGRGGKVFNPVVDRNRRFILTGGDYTLRDINSGEEILDNYLDFIGAADDWESDIDDLQSQCSGKDIGGVTEYEEYGSTSED